MRPTLRRLLVGTAAAAAAMTVAAAPASAATPKVSLLLPDATVAAGHDTLVSPVLFATRAIEINNASVTFELSGDLAGVSLAPPGDDADECTADGSRKVTCSVPFPIDFDQNGDIGWFNAELAATKDALGEKGKIKVTLTADGIAPISTGADVEVAEAVDLVAGKSTALTTKPGDGFDAALQVRNNAGTAAHGTALIFDTDRAFQSTKKFSNCFYDHDTLNACVFDQDLAAGRSYNLSVPYVTGRDTQAPGDASGEFEWLTSDDYNDLLNTLSKAGFGGPGAPGTGDKLELTAVPALKALAKTKQTDPNPDDNWQDVDLTVKGDNGVDLAAKGATFKGSEGQTVAVTVGVANVGPATLDWGHSGEPAAAVVVTPPTGTTVAKLPEGCRVNDLNPTSKVKQYLCLSSPIFPVGTSVTWTFGFKVNKASDNARGSVEVNPACACEIFSKDINKSNDTAAIVLNPVGGGGAAGGQNSSGGGLAITGPQTAVYGGAGAVLVAAGVAGFLLARRRRTRFEA
jgi:hypothetical protein